MGQPAGVWEAANQGETALGDLGGGFASLGVLRARLEVPLPHACLCEEPCLGLGVPGTAVQQGMAAAACRFK